MSLLCSAWASQTKLSRACLSDNAKAILRPVEVMRDEPCTYPRDKSRLILQYFQAFSIRLAKLASFVTCSLFSYASFIGLSPFMISGTAIPCLFRSRCDTFHSIPVRICPCPCSGRASESGVGVPRSRAVSRKPSVSQSFSPAAQSEGGMTSSSDEAMYEVAGLAGW